MKSPFIKFEASNKHYRPLRQEFNKFPRVDFTTEPWSCPFESGRRPAGRDMAGAEMERAEAEERDLPQQVIDADSSVGESDKKLDSTSKKKGK